MNFTPRRKAYIRAVLPIYGIFALGILIGGGIIPFVLFILGIITLELVIGVPK